MSDHAFEQAMAVYEAELYETTQPSVEPNGVCPTCDEPHEQHQPGCPRTPR